MKRELQNFNSFLEEALDPTYYQETFYFTALISMTKDAGGSRDETKNDIRALSEVLTVTLVEKEKGGVQKDLGTKYLSTLKIHLRKPKDVSKEMMMKRTVKMVSRLKGVSVLRYKEKVPTPRRKAFHGPGSYTRRVQNVNEVDYQKVRRQKSPAYAKMKKRLIGMGGNKHTGGGKGHTRPSMKRSKSAPGPFGAIGEELTDPATQPDTSTVKNKDLSRFDQLYEEVLITIGDDHDALLAFDIQKELNQKIWDGDEAVRPGVKAALLDIVEEFMESLDMEIDLQDVIVTGSIANFNWSKFSDIDLHILIDFNKINDNEEMVKRFFDAVRSNWNKLHDIRVKGHEVEIYVQHATEPHVSTGVYSLLNDRWLVKPKKVRPAIDRGTASKKMKHLAREIGKISTIQDAGNYEESFALATKIKEKIKKMRQRGLEDSGIYSPENLAFKMLRRSGDIEQLFAIYTAAYDKLYSLDQ